MICYKESEYHDLFSSSQQILQEHTFILAFIIFNVIITQIKMTTHNKNILSNEHDVNVIHTEVTLPGTMVCFVVSHHEYDFCLNTSVTPTWIKVENKHISDSSSVIKHRLKTHWRLKHGKERTETKLVT